MQLLRRISARRCLLALLVLLLGGQMTGQASLLSFADIDMQFRYDFREWKNSGEQTHASGNFTTYYGFQMRRSFLPGVRLISDMVLNTSGSSDINGRQSNRGATFNFYTRQPTYALVSRINYNNFSNSYNGAVSTTSTGLTSNYFASLQLKQPAYPQVNLQFQRNVSNSSTLGATASNATNNWLLSSQYQKDFLRFTYDQTSRWLSGESSDNGTTTRRGAVTMDYPILSGLTFTGELSHYMNNSGGANSTNMDQQMIRLSATPTRAISADLDYLVQSSRQQYNIGENASNQRMMSLNVRSEVRPGLYADFSTQRQAQDVTNRSSVSQLTTNNRRLDISARLGQDTIVSGGLIHADSTIEGAAASVQKQDSLQLSLQTSPSPRSDLSLYFGKDTLDTASQQKSNSTNASISLRNRTSPTLSLGAAYRYADLQVLSSQDIVTSQTIHTVDLDALWQPTARASANLRLTYQTNDTGEQQVQPSMNVRWQLDPRTNLGVNYSFTRNDLPDSLLAPAAVQQNGGLSANLSHTFLDGSSLNLSYDYQRSNVGTIEWQRQLRAYYSFRL